jgi:hypothetical protein
MKTFLTALAVCLVVAGVSAQNPPPTQAQNPPAQQAAPDQQKTEPEITLTGCLVQGSTPAVFIFENAKKDPKDTNEAAVKFIVLASTEDLNLRSHLNHQVRITGVSDGRVAPPTAKKVEEKDMPKLSAKSLTLVADTCAVPAR